MDKGGGYQEFPSKIFCPNAEKYRGGLLFSVSLISGTEKCWGRRGRDSRFSVEIVLFHSTETFPRGTLLCCVSENFRQRNSFWIRGGYQEFPSKTFCFTVPKNFVGESFSVSLISGIEKMLGIRGGEIHDFPSKLFCPTVLKHFLEEPFRAVFQKICDSEIVYG